MNVFYTGALIYVIVSFLEWYIHRYLMHETTNPIINQINYIFKWVYFKIHGYKQTESHVNHHKIVKNDGVVDEEDDGMLYSAAHIPVTTIVGFAIYYCITNLIGYRHTAKEYMIVLGLFGGVSYGYYLLWNILHPAYHEHGDPWFRTRLQGNGLYKFLRKYHMIHHMNKGDDKCNFNIILPGFDHLMGTFRWSIDNTEFCKKTLSKTAKEKELCRNT